MKHDPDAKPMNSHAWRQVILDTLEGERRKMISERGRTQYRQGWIDAMHLAEKIVERAEIPPFTPATK